MKYDKKRYQRRNCIEIMFGRLRTCADCYPIRPMPGNFLVDERLLPGAGRGPGQPSTGFETQLVWSLADLQVVASAS